MLLPLSKYEIVPLKIAKVLLNFNICSTFATNFAYIYELTIDFYLLEVKT